MASSLANEYVMQIPDMVFFQGDTISIPFAFYDGENNPIDLRFTEVYWYCCPYGKPKSPTLILNSVDTREEGRPKIIINEGTPNICYVNLNMNDTKQMTYIKYTQQPVVILKNSRGTRKYIRAEGNILFKPMISDF